MDGLVYYFSKHLLLMSREAKNIASKRCRFRNFFNSYLDTLGNSFHIPGYLFRILKDYLKNRFLFFDSLGSQRRIEISSGVARGSILRSNLWNGSYDSLLRPYMPEKLRLVSYALVVGHTELMQSRLHILVRRVNG